MIGVENQWELFLAFFSCGVLSVLISQILAFLPSIFFYKKRKFFISIALLIFSFYYFVKTSIIHQIPRVRVYMIVSEILGFYCYFKSFYKLLDFLTFVCYNKLSKILKSNKRGMRRGRAKVKKTNSVNRSNCNFTTCNFVVDYDLSNDSNQNRKR